MFKTCRFYISSSLSDYDPILSLLEYTLLKMAHVSKNANKLGIKSFTTYDIASTTRRIQNSINIAENPSILQKNILVH